MPFYEFNCEKHGRFEVRQPMESEHVSVCPTCGLVAQRRYSLLVTRVREPIMILQARSHGQEPVIVGKIPNRSYSDERNMDIPPDYPNLLEV